jgi:ABC-type multidrug transport system fused ATPase/permease subunit
MALNVNDVDVITLPPVSKNDDTDAVITPSEPGYLSWISASFVNEAIYATISGRFVEFPDWQMSAKEATRVLTTEWEIEKKNASSTSSNPSLPRALWRAFRGQFLLAASLKLCWGAFVLAGVSYFVRTLLAYIRFRASDSDHTLQEEAVGIGLCFGFLLIMLLLSLALQQMSIVSVRLGLRVEAAVSALIYEKSLVYDRSSCTVDITSLVSNDSSKLGEACTMIQYLWSGAIEAIAIICILIGFTGRSALPGLGVVILLIPVQYLIGALTANARKKSVAASDERVRFMKEVLTSMKLVKMYVWEELFAVRVAEERKKEADIQFSGGILKSINYAIVFAAPPLIALSIFGLHIFESPLEASLAFTTLSLFNTLRLPLVLLPKGLRASVEAKTSAERISTFLLLPDRAINESFGDGVTTDSITDDIKVPMNASSTNCEPGLIEIKDASFAPGLTQPHLLKDISMRLEPGSLTVITGTVGSGKSNLLLSLLGQMTCVEGTMRVGGKFGYVPQTPWCAHGTVRDNILFGKPWDEKRYRAVIYACALERDLGLLEFSDLTEIGERGMNLSGGQRQRIATARAVYAGADIVLLDAPLSAVDAYTSQHMFKHAIMGLLKGEGATVVLVTHQVELIPKADTLIVMQEGSIAYIGPPSPYAMTKFFPTVARGLESNAKNSVDSDGSITPKARKPALSDVIGDDFEEDSRLGPSTPKIDRSDSYVFLELRPRAPSVDQKVRRQVSVISTLAATSADLPLATVAVDKTASRLTASAESSSEKKKSTNSYLNLALELRWYIALVSLVIFLVTQLTRIYSDIFISSWVINKYSKEEVWYVSIYAAYVATFIVFLVIRGLVYFVMFKNAASRMHDVMANALLRAPMSFFTLTPLGSLLSVISKDMDSLSDSLADNMYLVFVYIFILGSTIGVVVAQVRIFLAVLAGLVILFILVCARYLAASKVLKLRAGAAASAVVAHVSETVQGIAVIQAFRAEKRYANVNCDKLLAAQTARFTMETLQLWLSVRQDLIGSLMVFGTCIMCVSFEKSLSPAAAGLAISNSFQILLFLSLMVKTAAAAHDTMASVDRIRALGSVVNEKDSGTLTSPTGWPMKGEVTFNNVVMSYLPDTPPVLKGVSFSIESGEKIGIVGRTGAGKSSLIQAIFRLAPINENSISIDGISSSELTLKCLRKNIAILPQEPVMFEGTLRSNLDPFSLRSDTELTRALEQCLLGDLLKSPGGLSQHVSSMGANFSLGQQQLVCLARALLNDSSLLLLDEATAALDSETDEKVQQVLRSAFAKRTILTIAHRIDTIIDSDRIIVMDAGRVVEFAPPAELIENEKSIFAELCKQSGANTSKAGKGRAIKRL